MMLGFVGTDAVSARERLEPWLCRCAYCGTRQHLGDSEPLVVHFCDAICAQRDQERRRSATPLDVGLSFAVNGIVALAAILGLATICRITFFGN